MYKSQEIKPKTNIYTMRTMPNFDKFRQKKRIPSDRILFFRLLLVSRTVCSLKNNLELLLF
jgi:hypothetical protein